MVFGAIAIVVVVIGIGYYSYERRRNVSPMELEDSPYNNEDYINSNSDSNT